MESWQQSRLKAALAYQERGISVIPIAQGDKVPCISSWRVWQKGVPPVMTIEQWWGKEYPGANIALICGEVSNLLVLDFDIYKDRGAYERFKELLRKTASDSFVVKTPRGGYHFYYRHREGLSNLRGSEAVDIKTNGGYVLAPPSRVGDGTYTFLHGKAIPEMPDAVFDFVKDLFKSNIATKINNGKATFGDTKKIMEGNRNEQLFSFAYSLQRGNTHSAEAQYYLGLMNQYATEPPVSEEELSSILNSSLQHHSSKRDIDVTNVSKQVREWVEETSGFFKVTSLYNECNFVSQKMKQAARVALHRLLKDGLIEKTETRGTYRRKEEELVPINFRNVKMETVPIWLPFDIHEKVDIMPKNIICIAGSPNVGKTALLLNMLRYNMNFPKWKDNIFYFSSEMGAMEFNTRLKMFEGIQLNDWRFQPYERTHNFHDVIEKDGFNIIDFLEISDNFYKISQRLLEIHNALREGIAVIALQKKRAQELGRGAEFSLEKPRLYLSLDKNQDDTIARGSRLTIVKAKNYGSRPNPNGSYIDFFIHNGWDLQAISQWGSFQDA